MLRTGQAAPWQSFPDDLVSGRPPRASIPTASISTRPWWAASAPTPVLALNAAMVVLFTLALSAGSPPRAPAAPPPPGATDRRQRGPRGRRRLSPDLDPDARRRDPAERGVVRPDAGRRGAPAGGRPRRLDRRTAGRACLVAGVVVAAPDVDRDRRADRGGLAAHRRAMSPGARRRLFRDWACSRGRRGRGGAADAVRPGRRRGHDGVGERAAQRHRRRAERRRHHLVAGAVLP